MGEYFTEVEARQAINRTRYAARDLPGVAAGTLAWVGNFEQAPNGEGYLVVIRWDFRNGRPFRYAKLTKDEFERDTTI